MDQKENTVGGDLAGRDITKNYYQSHPDLDSFFNNVSEKVKNLLPNKLYNFKYNERVEFNAGALFDSLVQIAIPHKVVLNIIDDIPNRISVEQNLETFSTRELRKLIYSSLQDLEYSKYGEKIDIWGENYIRKFGNPDVEVCVILDDQKRIKPLNYKFLYDELIPDIYYKCFHRDIDEELELIKSNFIKQEIASEIMEKVRILNLYLIRYSTLKKLSYDMAIQPPHPWFTNKLNTDSHLEYHTERYNRHLINFQQRKNIKRSAKEFIEHICAAILTKYNLFIGLGKYRPLITLTNYLKLNNSRTGNLLFWQTLEISNLPGDLFLEKVTFSKFKSLLDSILIRIDDCENHYNEVKDNFELIYNHTERLLQKRRELVEFNSSVTNAQDLKTKAIILFGYYHKMVVYEFRIKFSFIERISPDGILKYFNICYAYQNLVGNLYIEFSAELGKECNGIIVISNRDIHHDSIRMKIIEKFPDIDFIFQFTLESFYIKTISPNRRIEFESLLLDSQI